MFLSGIKPQFLRHPACNLVTVLAVLPQLFVGDQTAFQEVGINVFKEFSNSMRLITTFNLIMKLFSE